jgi:tetratricopeptide (TPR) repeat protein
MPDVTVSSKQLSKDYSEDRIAAEYKYEGKLSEINGKIIGKVKKNGLYEISLQGGRSSSGDVVCKVAASELETVANLTKGAGVTVRGTILGVPGMKNIVVQPCTILDEPTSTAKATQMPAAITVTLREMLWAYDSNELAAEQKYNGNIIEMEGWVKTISDDHIEIIPIASDQFQQSGAKCLLAPSQQSELVRLSERDLNAGQYGSRVTIKGLHQGFESFFYTLAIIDDCLLNPKKPVKAANTPKPSPTPGPTPTTGPTPTPRPTPTTGPTRTPRPTATPTPIPTPTRIPPTPTPVPTALDFYNKGEEYRKAGNWQAAITEYTRAIELNPSAGLSSWAIQHNSYFYRAYSYGNLGESIGETGPHWFNYGNAVADYSQIRHGPPYSSQQSVRAIPDVLAKVYFNRGWNNSKMNHGHIQDYDYSFTEGGGCQGGCPWPARMGNNRPYTGLSQVD